MDEAEEVLGRARFESPVVAGANFRSIVFNIRAARSNPPVLTTLSLILLSSTTARLVVVTVVLLPLLVLSSLSQLLLSVTLPVFVVSVASELSVVRWDILQISTALMLVPGN